MTRGNGTGNVEDRRRRRRWLVATFEADVSPLVAVEVDALVGVCRCYRCGKLLWDACYAEGSSIWLFTEWDSDAKELVEPLTVDRIVPGCRGGTYRRSNIRPACGRCNYSTGAKLRGKKR